MVKGDHSEGYAKTKQRKGRLDLRSSANERYATHKTQSIGDLEPKATDLREGDSGEFGKGQNNILT